MSQPHNISLPSLLRRLLVLLAVTIIGLMLVLLARGLSPQPNTSQVVVAETPELPSNLVKTLAQALRFPTISANEDGIERVVAFAELQQFLKDNFPLVYKEMSLTKIAGFSLLYNWQGSDPSLNPILLLAHQDVVPIEPGTEVDWSFPPFSGTVADGFLWGRGAWDDKSTLVAQLQAAELLLATGFQPKRGTTFAFGHDEEVGGTGAAAVAKHLEQQGQIFDFILDEGMPITEGIMPGVEAAVALVGTAEKGYLTVELAIAGSGGHSSMPPRMTVIAELAAAITALKSSLSTRLTKPVKEMLTLAAPLQGWQERIAVGNLWLFEGAVLARMKQSDATRALIETTVAPTIFKAGVKDNLLPQRASASVNVRLLPGDSMEQVVEWAKQRINNSRITIMPNYESGSDPSEVSSTDHYGYRLIGSILKKLDPQLEVLPTLVTGITDSRHYSQLSDQIYRFTPIRVGPEDMGRIHGTNERISVEDYQNMVRFYFMLLKSATSESRT